MKQRYGGKQFLFCIKEVVKNARDWGASLIKLVTATPDFIRIVDNGDGMDGDNRDAIFSVNATTANGERQSGKFCTGFKYLMYSYGTRIVIRTAPSAEPDLVYVFEIDVDEHEVILYEGRTFAPDVLPKDDSSWPYDFRTGTEITVYFRTPRSAAIRRGEKLGTELAACLSTKLNDIIAVDGAPLPPKDIVGERFIETHQDPQLGEIGFDLYHPRDKSGDEELLLTAGEVGEVPMKNFASQLGELRSRLGKTYRLEPVCGTITWHGLKDFVNEDRLTISGSIADSPHVVKFLRFLEKLEPQIRHRLHIKLESQGDDPDGSPDITPVVDLFNDTWGNPKDLSGTAKARGSASGPGTVVTPPSPNAAIQLDAERYEYEIGEKVQVTARVGRGYTFKVQDIQWHTMRSRSRGVTIGVGEVSFVADQLGEASISAEIPGTSHVSTKMFRFVSKRRPSLNAHNPEIEVNDEFHLLVHNADLVGGLVDWECAGAGILTVNGNTAVFTSKTPGRATVRILAPTGRELDRCEITIVQQFERAVTMRIQNFDFKVQQIQSGSTARPVRMDFLGADAKSHDLYINDESPALKDSVSSGADWETVLALGITNEFARFHLIEARGLTLAELSPAEVPDLIASVQRESWELFAETQRTRKKKRGSST